MIQVYPRQQQQLSYNQQIKKAPRLGLTNITERDSCNLFQPCVTLNFDLLTAKVRRFMPVHHGPLVLSKRHVHKFDNGPVDGQVNNPRA